MLAVLTDITMFGIPAVIGWLIYRKMTRSSGYGGIPQEQKPSNPPPPDEESDGKQPEVKE